MSSQNANQTFSYMGENKKILLLPRGSEWCNTIRFFSNY